MTPRTRIKSATGKSTSATDTDFVCGEIALLLTEMWIPSDAPDAVKLDVAPSGYNVVHRHRAASTERRGGGLAVINHDSFRATPVDVGDYSEFESRSEGRRSSF